MRAKFRDPSFDGLYWSEAGGSSQSITVSLGAKASATRLAVAIVASNGSAHTDTSLTLFGTAMTQVQTHASAAGNLSLYAKYVTTGQSGTAALVFSASVGRVGLALWSFEAASETAIASYTDATSPFDAAVALAAGRIAIVGSMTVNSGLGRPNWIAAKPLFISKIGSNLPFTAAMIRGRITETRNVQVTWDNSSTNGRLVGGVWA